jgi:hypothetical protein
MFQEIVMGKDFLDRTPNAQETKVGEWDYIKLKTVYNKGSSQQREEITYRKGENIFRLYT